MYRDLLYLILFILFSVIVPIYLYYKWYMHGTREYYIHYNLYTNDMSLLNSIHSIVVTTNRNMSKDDVIEELSEYGYYGEDKFGNTITRRKYNTGIITGMNEFNRSIFENWVNYSFSNIGRYTDIISIEVGKH